MKLARDDGLGGRGEELSELSEEMVSWGSC